MQRLFARPIPLVLILLCATFIPILSAPLRMFQIATSQLPADSLRFYAVPNALFLHSLGGMLFGILGPVQFASMLKNRFPKLHRISGRIFVIAGLMLAFSALRLLIQFPHGSTWVLVAARTAPSIGIIVSFGLALQAIRVRNIPTHRTWMIRAYAIGMGSATIAFIQLPIFLIRGEALVGYFADSLFVLSWIINLTLAEIVIRRFRN